MKKIFLLGAIILGLGSCSKNDAANEVKSDVDKQYVLLTSAPGDYTRYSAGRCSKPANDCIILPDVIVKPQLHAWTFENMSATEVAAFFSQPECAEWMNALHPIAKAKLLSGQYYLAFNYEDNNVINYDVGTTYPVTSSNFEFAVQFTK